MSIAKYPTYKATGLEWLEIIPSHWEVKRLKQFCDVFPSNVDKKTVEGETPIRLCNYTDVYYNDFIGENLEFMAATATEDQIDKFGLKAGDTIITKDSETADDIAIAAYVPQDLPGVICGYHLSMVRPREVVSGAFVKRLFDSAYAKSLMTVRANGLTRVGLSQYAIDNVELPLPPKEEQVAIANFLDRETAKIDALIAEQQRLIELLQEKRQAVISHAVTKGLNPNAPMKDSGVEWLGEVPEHWITGKLCYYARLDTGSTPDRQRPEYWNGDIPWVKTGEVRYEDIYETEERITELAIQETSCGLQQPGTLLMALYGQGVTRGRVGMLMTAASCNQACAAITPSTSIDGRYLELYLTNAYSHLRSLGNETTQQNLNLDFVGKLELLVPPLAEQEHIWQTTKQRTKELDALLLQSADAIVILGERRSAIISAAVTGQIDVRGLVQEVEEQ